MRQHCLRSLMAAHRAGFVGLSTSVVLSMLGAAGPLQAQDMTAVDWNGQVYSLDSRLGTTTLIGQGLFGQNAMAVSPDGTVWSTHRAGSNPNWTYSLTRVEPRTGTATIVHTGTHDVRAMAFVEGQLLAIVNGNSDLLYSVDLSTGAFALIGSTGSDGHQGMAVSGGVLYTWHVTIGLMRIDPVTGHATDVNPAVGGPGGSGVQFLAARSDGMLVGGKTAIYAIDPATGSYCQVGSLGAGIDLRGADEWFSNVTLFGSGCAGSHGNVTLGVTGLLGPGLQVRVASDNHAASALGAMVVGFSRTDFQGVPLPILLDPLLGTQGCSLLTSVDVPMFGLCSAVAPATLDLPLALPAGAAGCVLHIQHVVFEPVPGGLSASNAATLFVGY